jgi:hypothetical protein
VLEELLFLLHDGRQLTAYRDLRRGDPEDPCSWAGLQRRMRNFAPAMSDAQAAALATWCEGFTDSAQDALPCAPFDHLFDAIKHPGRQ